MPSGVQTRRDPLPIRRQATRPRGVTDIVVVTGPPGAGKSTIAALVAGSFDRSVHIHTDDFYAWIARGFIEPWRPEAHEQNIVIIGAIAAVADRLAAGGYVAVVDGIVGPWFLEPWRALARPVSYVVLRPSVETAEHRAVTRGEHPLKDISVVGLMHAAFAELGPFERHVVDSTAATADETAADVLRRLAAGELTLD
jgi:chloramphenicol 3-O-phosphotransferase